VLLKSPSTSILYSLTSFYRVILVHGLNGHYYRTWAGVASFWPRDFLSPDLKVCRIWSYGYNAVEALAVDGAGMELLAHDLIDRIVEKREKDDSHLPILWIAHSLGGLLVKTVILSR
jgi:protein SERAC1